MRTLTYIIATLIGLGLAWAVAAYVGGKVATAFEAAAHNIEATTREAGQ